MNTKQLILLLLLIPMLMTGQNITEKANINYDKKLKKIDSLKKIINNDLTDENFKNVRQVLTLYSNFSIDSALVYSDKIIKLAHQTKNTGKISQERINKATLLLQKNKFELAEQELNKNLLAKDELIDIILALTYTTLGDANLIQGKHEKSLTNYIEASQLFIKIRDSTNVARTTTSIGYLYHTVLDDFEKAKEYFEKSLNFLNDKNNLGLDYKIINLVYLSEVLFKLNDKKLSKEKLDQAEQLSTKNNLWQYLSSVYFGFARFYYDKNDYQTSLEYGFKSVDFSEKYPRRSSLKDAYKYLGLNYFKLKNYTKSVDYLEKSLYKYDSETYIALIDSYKNMGRYQEAFEYQKRFANIKDSLNNIEQTTKIIEITEKYENDKKQVEIETLNAKAETQETKLTQQKYISYASVVFLLLLIGGGFIWYKNYKSKQQLEIAKKELDKSKLQQRFLRTQLNPHFFFHALSSIESYMQKDKIEESAGFLQNFSKLMRTILESSDVDFVPLEEDISFIKKYLELQRLNHSFAFDYEITTHPDVNTKNIMIPPMLTQPFVENAILHGALKVEHGKVYITYSKDSDYLIIKITDNGKNDEQLLQESKKMYRSMSTDIIKQRIENLKKTYNMEIHCTILKQPKDATSLGTLVTFSIPLKYGNFKSSKPNFEELEAHTVS